MLAKLGDARLCLQQWESCSSYHPGGRADRFNWDLLKDGQGNPRNARSLLLAYGLWGRSTVGL